MRIYGTSINNNICPDPVWKPVTTDRGHVRRQDVDWRTLRPWPTCDLPRAVFSEYDNVTQYHILYNAVIIGWHIIVYVIIQDNDMIYCNILLYLWQLTRLLAHIWWWQSVQHGVKRHSSQCYGLWYNETADSAMAIAWHATCDAAGRYRTHQVCSVGDSCRSTKQWLRNM